MAVASVVCLCVFALCVLLLTGLTITSLPMIAATLIDFRRAWKAGLLLLLVVVLGTVGNVAWVVSATDNPAQTKMAEAK